MKKIGLALGGGGARGLCHIEFCRALDEMKIKPSIISGTSIGSIIGSFYAAGMSGAEMKELAETIDLFEYGKMIDISILRPKGLLKGKRVEEFLQKHLPVKTFEELKIPLKIVAADFWNRKQIIFQSGSLIPAIRASISIPAIFEPVRIDGIIMVDGGTVNPLPMNIIRNSCDILIAIDVSGKNVPSRKDQMPSIFDSIMMSYQIMETVFVKNQLEIVKPEVYIKPDLINIQILDFHKSREIMESVKNDVRKLKSDLKKLKGRKYFKLLKREV